MQIPPPVCAGMSQLNMHSQKAEIDSALSVVTVEANVKLLYEVFMKRFNYLWGRDVATALTAMEGVVNCPVRLLCPRHMFFPIFQIRMPFDITASISDLVFIINDDGATGFP